MSSQSSLPSTRVTAVAVSSTSDKGAKHLTSAELLIGSHKYKLICDDNGTLRQDFPDVELSLGAKIVLHYKTSTWPLAYQKLRIDNQRLFASYSSARQDLSVVQDGIRIAFSCQPASSHSIPQPVDVGPSTSHDSGTLPLTTKTMLKDCPRFRILVIGKSGVGKSSLIRIAFGIEKANASDLVRGDADIQVGLQSPVNDRLILHDSLEFESGEKDNYNVVNNFIRSRRTGDLQDQLHAVWFCVPTPRASARLLEVAAENFFKSKKDTMGSIPLIVVYTKQDLAVDERMTKLSPSNPDLDEESLMKLAISEVESTVKERQESINRLARESVPYVVVSSEQTGVSVDVDSYAVAAEPKYKYTFQKIVETTYRQVGIPDTPEAHITSLVTLMAQRVLPSLKIKGTIDVGKQRYWRALMASPHFKGHTIWECLSVIHADIVAVWNFNDPDRRLLDKKFQERVVDMVKKMEVSLPANPSKFLAIGASSLIAAIPAFLATIANPAAPIVLPIIAGAVAAVWLYKVYQNVPKVQLIFVAYIVHLTHIMEALFVFTARDHKKLTRRVIKAAYMAYNDSGLMSQVHNTIQGLRDSDSGDTPLQLIESLIHPEQCCDSSFKDYFAKIDQLDLAKFHLDKDEEW